LKRRNTGNVKMGRPKSEKAIIKSAVYNCSLSITGGKLLGHGNSPHHDGETQRGRKNSDYRGCGFGHGRVVFSAAESRFNREELFPSGPPSLSTKKNCGLHVPRCN
jgi:hypothetical protein